MSQGSRLPIATLILIVANIVAAFAAVWQPDLVYEFGFNPLRPTFQSVFTCLFLHANLFHLLANMLFLAAVGAAVELATGTLRFVIVYFASGLAGVGLHALLAARNTFEPHPLVGASGCIAGCAAYYGVRYLGLRVPIAPNRGVPVAAVIGAWMVFQLLGAFKTIGDSSASTAFWAHLGGFGAGMLLSVIFRAPDVGQLKLNHAVLEQMNERGPAAGVAAALRHLEIHPDDPRALQQLIDAHRMMNDVDGEAGALARIIDLLPDENIEPPVLRLYELGEMDRLSAVKRVRLAERLASSQPRAAECLLESVISEPQNKAQRADAMLDLAGLKRESDPGKCQAILDQLIAEDPLHPAVGLARTRGWIE